MDIRQHVKHKLLNFRFVYVLVTALMFISQFTYFYVASAFGMPTLMRNQHGILHQYISSPKLVIEFLLFAVAQIIVSAIFFSFVYWVIQKNKTLFNLSRRREFLLGFLILFLAVCAILFANNYYFQFSRFAFFPYGVKHAEIGFLLYFFFALAFSAFLGLALFEFSREMLRAKAMARTGWLCVSAVVILAIGLPFTLSIASKHHDDLDAQNTVNKPNVIIIGVDSLRPDYVAALDGKGRRFVTGRPSITPNIDSILHGSTIVANSYTPLARTFPAWVSILTGEYPDQNGIYFNLMDPKQLDQKALLTHKLKKMGYYNVFGMDDRRFSNIDKRYGFDAIIGPQEGMNDFLLGTLNDFPLTNLLVNSKLGRLLFPYSYGNRSGAITYDPASFDAMVDQRLAKLGNQPLFLAVHFCLPHWPYYWAVMHPRQGPYLRSANLQFVYEQGVLRADQQVGAFWNLLQARGLLKNAIVIVLSDHGESLLSYDSKLFKDDKYTPGSNRPADLFQVRLKKELYGHGAYLSTLFENHNVLAFRVFGEQKNQPGQITALASLIDVKPTLFALLKQNGSTPSGVSFANQIMQGKPLDLVNRGVMMQTGLNVVDLQSEQVPVQKMLDKGLNFYQVDPKTGLVTLQESYLPRLIKEKARSIRYQNWYLIAFPAAYFTKVGKLEPRAVLINLQTGEWTDNLASSFAQASPEKVMLKQMKALFGSNINLNFPELSGARVPRIARILH